MKRFAGTAALALALAVWMAASPAPRAARDQVRIYSSAKKGYVTMDKVVKAVSVPASRVTRYCSGVRAFFQSASLFTTLSMVTYPFFAEE